MPRARRGPGAGQQVADLEHAGQVQPDQAEQDGQARDEAGGLQLETPAQLLAARAQGQQQPRQRQEAHHDAAGVGQPTGQQGAPVLGMCGEAEDLERQHREDAGHQVEQGAACQGQQQGPGQGHGAGPRAAARTIASIGEAGGIAMRRRRRARTGCRPGSTDRDRQLHPGRFALTRQHRRQQRRALAALGRQRHRRHPDAVLPAGGGRGGVVDHAGGLGEEVELPALPGRRQALHPHLQGLGRGRVAHPCLRLHAGHAAWTGSASGVEQRGMGHRGRLGRDLQRETP